MPRSRKRRSSSIQAGRTVSWTTLVYGLSLSVLCQLIAIVGTLSIFKTMTLAQAVAINVGFTVSRLLFVSLPNIRAVMVALVTITLYVYWLFALVYGISFSLTVIGLSDVAILAWPVATGLLFVPDYLVVRGLGYTPIIHQLTKDS